MKVENSTEKETIKRSTISIELETLEEALLLYALFNQSNNALNKLLESQIPPICTPNGVLNVRKVNNSTGKYKDVATTLFAVAEDAVEFFAEKE